MQVDAIRTGGKTYHYLRHSVRKGKTVRKKTLANLSHLPEPAIRAVRAILAGRAPIVLESKAAVRLTRSRLHGHARAALGSLRRLGLERDLDRQPSRQRAITEAAARILDRWRMRKHFRTEVGEGHFRFQRREAAIAQEAALDGFHVIRTSVTRSRLPAAAAVAAYKRLARIETVFARLKSHRLRLRPIRHRLEPRVRAHLFIALLAAHLEYHLRRELAPLLFQDEHPDHAEAATPSPVAPAQLSPKAQQKRANRRGTAGFPLLSFPDLLKHLASLTWNHLELQTHPPARFQRLAQPTPLQREAFRLLKLKLP